MIASILVGIAGDNAILYLFLSGRGKSVDGGLTRMGPASWLVAIGTMAASSVFFFGYFAPMRTLGLMLIAGFALVFFGDVFVLRSLLPSKK